MNMTTDSWPDAVERGKIKAWYSKGGSLMVSEPIEGVTQDLAETTINPEESMEYYEGRYFVCETIGKTAAKTIALGMGWEWIRHAPENEDD